MNRPNKSNSGALFQNNNKSEKSPDFNGHCNIVGTEYWFAAWIKIAKNGDHAGEEFFSINVRPKDNIELERPINGMFFKNEEKSHHRDPDYTGFIEGLDEHNQTPIKCWGRVVQKEGPRKGEDFITVEFEVS